MPEVASTVFVVDDDASVREALEDLLRLAGWTPRGFDSAGAFLVAPPALGPSCLVLDVNLPDVSGLELQSMLAREGSGIPIVFITAYGDIPMSVRAMKAGAVEFLTKPFGEDVLLAAVGAALERSRAMIGERMVVQSLRDRYATLSRRESEVMGLVVSGLLNKQVGGELGISEITVKAHRGRVMEKMKAGSLAELVKMSARLSPPAFLVH